MPHQPFSVEIYSFVDDRELCEYFIKNLDNDFTYKIILVSKNKTGISEVSNSETVIPNKNYKLNSIDDTDSYDDSFTDIPKNTVFNSVDLNTQKGIYEKQLIINELKNITLNKSKHSVLVVPPGIWFSFTSSKKKSVLVNLINNIHSDKEILKSKKIKNYYIK